MSLKTHRYMTEFRCTGHLCEDHCCKGWSITLSPENHRRLNKAAKDTPKHATRLKSAIRTGGGLHSVALDANDQCSLFEPDGHCYIHSNLGEELLPSVCATYPRLIYKEPEGHKMAGALSCPEVTRQLLLNSDSIVRDKNDDGPSDIAHYIVESSCSRRPKGIPVTSDTQWLPRPTELMSAADALIETARDGLNRQAVQELIRECWDPTRHLEPAMRWNQYQERKTRLTSQQHDRWTRYFRHLAWYYNSLDGIKNDLATQILIPHLAQLTLFRLLLVNHPNVITATTADLGSQMDDSIISIVYRTHRAIERSSLLADITGAIENTGKSDNNIASCLLKF